MKYKQENIILNIKINKANNTNKKLNTVGNKAVNIDKKLNVANNKKLNIKTRKTRRLEVSRINR